MWVWTLSHRVTKSETVWHSCHKMGWAGCGTVTGRLWEAERQLWQGEWHRCSRQTVPLQWYNHVLWRYQNGFDMLSYGRTHSQTFNGVFRTVKHFHDSLWDALSLLQLQITLDSRTSDTYVESHTQSSTLSPVYCLQYYQPPYLLVLHHHNQLMMIWLLVPSSTHMSMTPLLVINTNLPSILHRFQVRVNYMSNFR